MRKIMIVLAALSLSTPALADTRADKEAERQAKIEKTEAERLENLIKQCIAYPTRPDCDELFND